MSVEKAVAAGGKLTTAATWDKAELPTATIDCQVTSTTTGKVENTSAFTCRGINFAVSGEEFNKECKQEGTWSLGGSTATEATPANVGLKLSAAMTYNISAGTPKLKLGSTNSTQTITSGGHTLPPIELTAASSKWQLEDALTLAAASSLTVERGELKSNGQAVSVGKVVGTFPTLAHIWNFGASTVTFTGTGQVLKWERSSAEATIVANEATVVISDTSTTAKEFWVTTTTTPTFGTVTITGDNVIFGEGNAAWKIGTLNVNNKAKSGETPLEGLRLVPHGSAYEVTVLATNGKVGALAKLTSATPGTRVKIKLPAGKYTVEGLEWKDIEVEGAGVELYAGTTASGAAVDAGNNVGVKFEAPPGASTGNVVTVV